MSTESIKKHKDYFLKISPKGLNTMKLPLKLVHFVHSKLLRENTRAKQITLMSLATFIFYTLAACDKKKANFSPSHEVQSSQMKTEINTKKQGEDFLKANKSKDEVKTTASGLQYKVLRKGEGQKPKAKDKVKVHYRGTFINGEEFDSSYKRNDPASFPLNRVIKGWQEGLQLMKEGAKYQFYIPSELAYGSKGRPKIPGHSVLIFEVELLKVISSSSP